MAGAVYTVVGSISMSGGDCITVSAPRITIQVNGATIYSPQKAIHILSTASEVHVTGPGNVSQTIYDEGNSALIEGLTVGYNGPGSAIVLEGVKESMVRNNNAGGGDDGYSGIVLDNTVDCKVEHNRVESGWGSNGGIVVTNSDQTSIHSKNNVVSDNNVSKNGIGIFVDGVGPTCSKQTPSLGNRITGNKATHDRGTDSPGVGIYLGCGARHTILTNNTGLHDWNYDAFDNNPNCRTNEWKDNKFRNVYPSCILGLPAKEKVLHAFQGLGDGYNPVSGLVFDKDGNLYGTVPNGGTGCQSQGCGYIFKLTPSRHGWTKTTVYEFTGLSGDGVSPSSALVLDPSGNLYGETTFGGLSKAGTVFQLSRNSDGKWSEKIIYTFSGGGGGGYPYGGMIFDRSGNLYGVASGGLGNPQQCGGSSGCGVVFELSPQANGTWNEQLIYSFQPNGTDGIIPNGGIAFDANGNLFGSTYVGGANGQGIIYELTPTQQGTWQENVIHNFANDDNGRSPLGGVVFDGLGNLFGTTRSAGSGDAGTVFELSPGQGGNWIFTLLHTFKGIEDVGIPVAQMIRDAQGNLYGTAEGDPYNWPSVGSVFKMSQSGGRWRETVLYRFGGGPDGGYPIDSLILDAAGNLYGTAYDGGTPGCNFGCGVVFEVVK
jgi:uncharacterized repeat protein (TIGR03803 family)